MYRNAPSDVEGVVETADGLVAADARDLDGEMISGEAAKQAAVKMQIHEAPVHPTLQAVFEHAAGTQA